MTSTTYNDFRYIQLKLDNLNFQYIVLWVDCLVTFNVAVAAIEYMVGFTNTANGTSMVFVTVAAVI